MDSILVDKCLQLAARDYERRWGCASNNPNTESHIYIRWEMPKATPSGWLCSREN
jgi:hypothetical protein